MSTSEWTLSNWDDSDRDGVGAPIAGTTDGTPQAREEFVRQTQGIDGAAETVPVQHDRHRDYRRSYQDTRGTTSRIDERATNNPAPTGSTAHREPRRDACTTSDQDNDDGHGDGGVSLTATTQAFDVPGESQSLHSNSHSRHMEPRRTRSKMEHQNTVAPGDERLPQRDRYFIEEELRPFPLGDTVALEDVARDCVSPLPAAEEQHHAPRQDNGFTSEDKRDTSPVPVLLAAGDHAQDGRHEVVKAIAPSKEGVCVNWDVRGKKKQLLQQQPPKTDDVDVTGNRAPESDADADADAHGQRSTERQHLLGLSPRATGNGVNIRHVVVAEQEATAFSLVDAVQAALGVYSPSSSFPDGVDNDEDLGCTRHASFWSLTIQRCQLSFLLPTTRLLHLMGRMCGMDIVECTGLILTGLEQVLVHANCLRTLTVRRCGLTRLPQLRSGSVEVLDLGENCIKSTAGLETLFRLKRLNLASNSIRNLTGLRPLIPLGIGCLRELNLHGNPVQETTRYDARKL